ncbi:hypothetical protein CRYUN_Cryun39dG0077200 [Craigia yunnanensis]
MELNRHNNPNPESAEEYPSEEEVNRRVEISSEIIPSKSEASVEIGEEKVYHHGDTYFSSSSNPCIFRTPFPGLEFQEPQLASIGPYHKGKNLPLEKYKYSFLEKFMNRTRNQGKDLCFYVRHMITLEWRIRRCYAEDLPMSSAEFVEMMLVDGCFILEVLRHCDRGEESEDGFFPIEPWQIPILVQDLLILENQIPFFVLEKLFDLSESEEGTTTVSVPAMALKFFDLAFPRSMDFSCKSNHLEANHLLDFFLESIRPSNPFTILNSLHLFLNTVQLKIMVIPKSVYSILKKKNTRNQAGVSKIAEDQDRPLPNINPKLKESLSRLQSEPSISKRVQLERQCHPPPPVHLIKRVMELRTSDIEFRPRRACRFTDINFKNGVLAIPPVTINDLFLTILINCVAFEQRSKRSSKDLTAYVSFKCRLIRHPTDVEVLCSNGIISRFSHNDEKVAESLQLLWLNLFDLDIQDSYLCKTLMEIERYYTRDGNGTRWCWRRHFLRYSRIVLFCITNFLFGFSRLKSGVNLLTHFLKEVKFLGGIIRLLSQGYSSFICGFVFRIDRLIHNSNLALSKFLVFLFLNLIILMIHMGSKRASNFDDDCEIPPSTLTDNKQDIEVEYSLNKSEQSMGDSSGVSCSYETATMDKKVIEVDYKSKEISKKEEDYDGELYMEKNSEHYTELYTNYDHLLEKISENDDEPHKKYTTDLEKIVNVIVSYFGL